MLDLVAIAESSIKIIFLLALPSLLLSLVIGLSISIFQAVTQVQDVALAFVPKIMIITVTSVILMPWMTDKIKAYAMGLWGLIRLYGE